MEQPRAPSTFTDRAAQQQRRLLSIAAALIAAYYLFFALAGVYPLRAMLVGLLIPLVLSLAAWRGQRPREAQAWPLAVTAGMSALAVATASLAEGTHCIGFHAIWALPLIYSILVPYGYAACVAGSALSAGGGLLLMLHDGRPPWLVLQWLVMAVGAAAFGVHRVRLNQRDLAVLVGQEAQATQRLASSEERYRLLAENTHDVIWTIDLATLRFTYVSPSILAQRGYTVEETLAQGIDELLTPESFSRAAQVLAKIGTPGEADPHLDLYEQPCRDGSIRQVEISASLRRDAQGVPFEVIGVSRDVTKRVEAERQQRLSEERFQAERERLREQMQQSQKLEAVGRLAGGVAHDFNNLLSAVLGFAETSLLETRPGTQLHESQVLIRDAALQARDLVKQILVFGKRDRPAQRPVDVAAVVDEALPLVRAAIPKSVSFSARLDFAAGVTLADPGQLHQIVLNLCSNARDAVGEGGRIDLSLEAVALEQARPGLAPGLWVRLRVRDNGSGIDAATRARLFEPYLTTKALTGGHGLGLAVVHGIVTSSGGAIEVESAPGAGSTFDVYLPRTAAALTPSSSALSTMPRGHERVLLVDDEPLVRKAHRRLLGSLGYEVVEAGEGEEALALLAARSSAIDLVFTDQDMPRLDGVGLAKAVSERWPGMRVILCSGYSDNVAAPDANAAGVRALLGKPVERALMAETVRRVLDQP